ncbi:alpha/beta hydrolase [Streptomyces sp. NPDC051322]|uniref:alpha/beta hydrolase n=1 Tax=Streptomyces sp. NPDC051322 TaxID=3154645 RepID=UPI00344C2B3D
MKRKINFNREGLTLVGDLFMPDGFDESGHYPAVIVQGSFTSVKEMMSNAYAEKFAEQGFVALAFDYAHYGESTGEPRQFESTDEKLSDLQAAVTYLGEQPYVQAVGMVGVCTSASNGAYLAAQDPRLKGFATIAAFLSDENTYKLVYGEDGVTRRLADAAAARRRFEETGEATTITVYSETDEQAVNYAPTPGAYDYYTNPARGNVPEYENEFDVTSWDTWVTLDALGQAPKITTPTMVVHSDGAAFPDQAKKLYETVQGEKELVWADGNHFDYYDSPAQMDNAVENVTRFFRTHLA